MTTMIDREFIRHPSEIPLEYCMSNEPLLCAMDNASNVSAGGLSFNTDSYIEPNQWLHLYIPIHEEYFETDAQVRWCTRVDNDMNHKYRVGVSFRNGNDAFSARMVEQICYIEEYKKKIKQQEGRQLSSDQAAAEWIEKYAEQFPHVV